MKEFRMHDQDVYDSAPQSADATIGFYFHLMIYSFIILMLFGIYLMNSQSTLWFEFPFLGWGIGLLIHGLIVFALAGSKRLYESEQS
jgi:hypothetical protein